MSAVNDIQFPSHVLCMNFVGLVDGAYLLVMVDYFNKIVQVYLCDKANARHVIRDLERWVKSKEVVCSIRTDGGKHFDNCMLSSWVATRNVDHQFSLPHDHRTNDLTTQCNKTILQMIRRCRSHRLQSPW